MITKKKFSIRKCRILRHKKNRFIELFENRALSKTGWKNSENERKTGLSNNSKPVLTTLIVYNLYSYATYSIKPHIFSYKSVKSTNIALAGDNSIARLAQSVEHETLNLRVVGSSPTLGGINFFFIVYVFFFR